MLGQRDNPGVAPRGTPSVAARPRLMPIDVAIVDDHGVMRDGLQAMLSGAADVRVVACEGGAAEGIEAVLRTRPQVVLMDITMPGMSGIEATQKLQRAAPQCGVLMLSMHSSPDLVGQAIRAGARGYVLKESSSAELLAAIRAVAEGRRYLGAGVSEGVMELIKGGGTGSAALAALTPRERQVLELIVDGRTNAQAAAVLHLSPRSVETYRGRLMQKLGISDLPSLVKFAIRNGITAAG